MQVLASLLRSCKFECTRCIAQGTALLVHLASTSIPATCILLMLSPVPLVYDTGALQVVCTLVLLVLWGPRAGGNCHAHALE